MTPNQADVLLVRIVLKAASFRDELHDVHLAFSAYSPDLPTEPVIKTFRLLISFALRSTVGSLKNFAYAAVNASFNSRGVNPEA